MKEKEELRSTRIANYP